MGIMNSIKVFIHYSYLLKLLISRDFKVKYKRSILGVLWSVLNPLFTMLILNLVFSTLFAGSRYPEIPDFPVYLLTGLVIFNYFTEATNLSMGAIISNFNLITKVYIPKYIFPLSKVLSSALNLLFSLIPLYLIFFIQMLMYRQLRFTWANILLPYDLFCVLLFVIGVGLFLSALTVFFRDMFYIWGIVTTAWMYLTPIVYPLSMITNSSKWYVRELSIVMKFNPLYHYINYARTIILFGNVPSLSQHIVVLAMSLITLAVGLLFFRSRQDKFIYYI